MKIPVATLSFSGKGKKVIIEALSPSVEVELTNLLESNISTPTQTRISPSNRKEWMLALPKANSMLYIFRTVETISNIIEEEDNGNEEKNDEDHDLKSEEPTTEEEMMEEETPVTEEPTTTVQMEDTSTITDEDVEPVVEPVEPVEAKDDVPKRFYVRFWKNDEFKGSLYWSDLKQDIIANDFQGDQSELRQIVRSAYMLTPTVLVDRTDKERWVKNLSKATLPFGIVAVDVGEQIDEA